MRRIMESEKNVCFLSICGESVVLAKIGNDSKIGGSRGIDSVVIAFFLLIYTEKYCII